MKSSELMTFVYDEIDEKLTVENAYIEVENSRSLRVIFQRNHEELYKKLLLFCVEKGGIILETNVGNYSTVIYCINDAG